jgi:hypothetical protein
VFHFPTFGQFSNCVKHLHLRNTKDNFYYLFSFSVQPTIYIPAFTQTSQLVLCLVTFQCVLPFPMYEYVSSSSSFSPPSSSSSSLSHSLSYDRFIFCSHSSSLESAFLVSSRPFSRCVSLLPRICVPLILPSLRCFRRQLLCQRCPFQSTFLCCFMYNVHLLYESSVLNICFISC